MVTSKAKQVSACQLDLLMSMYHHESLIEQRKSLDLHFHSFLSLCCWNQQFLLKNY